MAGKRGDDANAEDDQQRPRHDPRSEHLHPLEEKMGEDEHEDQF